MNPGIPERLGDFEIIRELGRGGMGVVYEARQVSLNRKVALKVLASALGLTERAVDRFRREAEAAAKLHHTNVVPVYATGECDGVHYYAMELIAGPSLDHVLRHLRQQPAEAAPPPAVPQPEALATGPYVRGAASSSTGGTSGSSLGSSGSGGGYFDTIARMVAEVADALDYAHKQGVIHRDVKPSNLLLSPEGRLSLNDFGLARMLEQPGMTVTGEFVGTPAYVSPEQITSGRIPLDHRTDVYSLGATLYEMLTLRVPFVGERRDQVLAQIIQKEPPPPRSLNRQIPHDLETICLKAMEKDPDRRYQTAGEMAADLRRYVERIAILARRAGPVERAVKWVRRHPGLSGGLACALLGLVVAVYFAWRANDEARQREEEARRQAELLRQEKRQNALDRALAAATGGDPDAAERAIEDAERVGALNGQVRMLRGLVALHRGKSQEALKQLELAVELLPGSVAARGMLAAAYGYDGQWDRVMSLIEEMQHLRPETPEDFLYQGYAEANHDPARGLRAIEKVIVDRPSMLVAHLLHAEVQVWHAQETGNLDLARRAAKKAEAVKGMLPADNSTARWVSLHAHLTAAGAFERNHDPEGQRESLRWAAADADALAKFPALPDAVLFRWLYFREAKKESGDAVLKELRRASEQTDHAYVAFYYALTLYRRGELSAALQVLEKRKGWSSDLLRVVAIADSQEPGWRERATSARNDLERRYADGWSFFTAQTVLPLLGDRRAAIASCRELHKRPERLPVLRRQTLQKVVAYNAELLTTDELEKVTADSQWDRCQAQYVIGMRALSEGRRGEAMARFRNVVATRAFFFSEYDLSWALLGRLENDPSWPPWIPPAK